MNKRHWTTEPVVLAQLAPEACTWDEWQAALERVIPRTWQVIHAVGP